MSSPGLVIEPLDSGHDLTRFACGNDVLDGWLRRHAVAAQEMDSARTFVLIRQSQVIGYFSLTMGSVVRQDAPARLVRGLPSYPIGMVLLARLAVDETHQGNGFGGMLLAEALRKAVTAGDAAAVTFYERNGFINAPEHPRRLYRRMKDIRASLDHMT